MGAGRAGKASQGRAPWASRPRSAVVPALVTSVAALAVCAGAAWLARPDVGGAARAAGATAGLVLPGGVALAVLRRPGRRVGPADLVTLARSVLGGGAATLVLLAIAAGSSPRSWPLLALVVPALLLDAVDGAVARHTGTSSRAGARLDMESDAAFLVVLSAAAAVDLGGWALLVGAMRYAFVAIGRIRPAWRAPLAPSLFRRVVAAIQGAALAVALAPVVPGAVARVAVAAALALLVVSFGRDIAGLERRARREREGRPSVERLSVGSPKLRA